jgi:ABC-type oligopeptide transport system substrate-binding subunit
VETHSTHEAEECGFNQGGNIMKNLALLIAVVLILPSSVAGEEKPVFELTLICLNTSSYFPDLSQELADEFSNIGIDVTVASMSYDELSERIDESGGKLYKNGGFDGVVWSWIQPEDYDTFIYEMFHSDNSVSRNPHGDNVMSWENPENDTLIDSIRKESDEEKARSLWISWQELFYEEQPLIPIYYFYTEYKGQKVVAYSTLELNLNHPALKKDLVRQALSHAVPRQRICNEFNKEGSKKAYPCAVPIDPEFFGYDADIKPYSYDPDAARELLFKAGFNVRTKKHEKAESLLQEAEEAYAAFEFENAVDLASQAKVLYEDLGDEENIDRVNDLISQYQEAVTDAAEAEELLAEGKQLKDQGEFEISKQRLLEARDKFQSLGMTQKITEVDALLSELDDLIYRTAVLKEADSLFDKGKEAYEGEDFEAALQHFQQAKEKYESINSEKAAECDEWIEKTQTEMEKGICLGTVMILGFIGQGLLVLLKKKK